MKKDEISEPINYRNNFIVIIKHDEKGYCIKPLDAVYENIKNNLEELKRKHLKNIQIQKTKTTHSLIINRILDPGDLLYKRTPKRVLL